MQTTTHYNPQTDETLGEKALLTNAFQPALIYTYHGGQHVEVKNIETYALNSQSVKTQKPQRMKKNDVLFAIKADTLATVKAGITLDKDVKARNLRTPRYPKDRPVVLTQENLAHGHNRNVRIVMRSGHVLRGYLLQYSRYNLVLNIGGALVLVYRHGVLEYSVRPESHKRTG